MKTWMSKRMSGALALAFMALPSFGSLLWTEAAAAGKDREPPVVLVQQVDPIQAGESVSLRAQVVDPSGIGNVVLWVRGEQEKEFKQIPMRQVGDDQVEAQVQPWPGQGSQVAYYIEARDALGNGPAFAGAPRTPYVLRVKGAAPAPASEAQTNWALRGITAVSLIALVGGYFVYRHIARNRLHAELNAELDRLTGVTRESRAAMNAPARDPVQARRRTGVPRNPAEQAFWIGLLTPVSHMGMYDREHALQSIAVRAHHHPTLGKRFFDVPTLSRHLKWVERDEIHVTADMLAEEPPTESAEEAEVPPN